MNEPEIGRKVSKATQQEVMILAMVIDVLCDALDDIDTLARRHVLDKSSLEIRHICLKALHAAHDVTRKQ